MAPKFKDMKVIPATDVNTNGNDKDTGGDPVADNEDEKLRRLLEDRKCVCKGLQNVYDDSDFGNGEGGLKNSEKARRHSQKIGRTKSLHNLTNSEVSVMKDTSDGGDLKRSKTLGSIATAKDKSGGSSKGAYAKLLRCWKRLKRSFSTSSKYF